MERTISLTEEQREVFTYFLKEPGSCVILTGPAGTGKSAIIRSIYAKILEMGREENLTMLGSTGSSAAAMGSGASTVHSFGRISVSEESLLEYITRLKSNPHVLRKMMNTKFLIIDEVSMLHGLVLMKLDLALRIAMRKPGTCFGGISVMLVGDFFQLPPVFSADQGLLRQNSDDISCNLFAFEVFRVIDFNPKVFRLKKILRQDEERDLDFVNALSEARLGRISYSSLETLQKCKDTKFPPDGITPTVVVLTNREAEAENHKKLFDSDMEMVTFRPYWVLAQQTEDRNAFSSTENVSSMIREHVKSKYIRNNPLLSQNLRLRTGAQVMFRRNLSPEHGITNGARGVVVGWVDCDMANVTKCLSVCDESCNDTPEGMAMPVPVVYVAAARRRYAVNLFSASVGTVITDNHSVRHVVFFFMPLSLAYAITAHKAQGLTLDRMIFDIKARASIPPSLMYVVFSRAKGSRSICVTGTIKKSMFWVHPRLVRAFDILEQRGSADALWPEILDHQATVKKDFLSAVNMYKEALVPRKTPRPLRWKKEFQRF